MSYVPVDLAAVVVPERDRIRTVSRALMQRLTRGQAVAQLWHTPVWVVTLTHQDLPMFPCPWGGFEVAPVEVHVPAVAYPSWTVERYVVCGLDPTEWLCPACRMAMRPSDVTRLVYGTETLVLRVD